MPSGMFSPEDKTYLRKFPSIPGLWHIELAEFSLGESGTDPTEYAFGLAEITSALPVAQHNAFLTNYIAFLSEA